jgi:cob(I)alamin adenosyltransferase
MRRIDAMLSHVWMVRTFLKHSDEALEEDELRDVQRTLYDVMLALGPAWQAQEPDAYLRQMRKKMGRLRAASEQFTQIQPEISTHTNFQMAAQSLRQAVLEIETTLKESTHE